MVLAGWYTRDRNSVLSRAPPVDEHRTALHARSGGRQPQLVDANIAPRGGARHRFGLSFEAAQPVARRVRTGLAALPRRLPAAAGKPAFRAALGRMVCAGSSDGRL